MTYIWKRVTNVGIIREDYTATIGGDGYQVRRFAESVGRGNLYHASVRCSTIGDDYPTVGKAILACLVHAGIAEQAQHHMIDTGAGLVDVQF